MDFKRENKWDKLLTSEKKIKLRFIVTQPK